MDYFYCVAFGRSGVMDNSYIVWIFDKLLLDGLSETGILKTIVGVC